MLSVGSLIDCTPDLMNRTLDAAFRVHRTFGPGLLESVYEKALQTDLRLRGINALCQVPISVSYEGCNLGVGFRADLVVAESLLVEVKAVERLGSIHVAQVITYLKLLNLKRGFIINFNTELLRNGVRRIAI